MLDMTPKKIKRVSIKRKKCPNPLFVKWMKEWIDEAVLRNSNIRFGYRKALKSLQSYPLVLRCGKDCGVLQDFGPKLCARLDRKLAEHVNLGGVVLDPKSKVQATSTATTSNASDLKTPAKKIRIKTTKIKATPVASTLPSECQPSTSDLQFKHFRSSPEPPTFLQTNKHANPIIPKNVTSLLLDVVDPSVADCPVAMNYLSNHGGSLVSSQSMMTGLKTGKQNAGVGNVLPHKHGDLQVAACSTTRSSGTCTSSQFSPTKKRKKSAKEIECKSLEDVILLPGSFEIILVVDNAELFGNSKAKESATRTTLTSLNVAFHVRSLKVGDFTWIAQDSNNGHELVLPYIVERKRIDDLAGSIKDGRYREQKFRLKQSGIQNKIYLIENMGKCNKYLGLPAATLTQASINTQVHGGFSVKHTSSHFDSMKYLATLTKVITRTYKSKILVKCHKENLTGCNINDDLVSLMGFEEFNKGSRKVRKWHVREMFIKQLVQLRGLSVEKAVAIVERYPTPRLLMNAYAEGNGETLLAKIPFGNQARKLGPVISAAVHKLYTMQKLT